MTFKIKFIIAASLLTLLSVGLLGFVGDPYSQNHIRIKQKKDSEIYINFMVELANLGMKDWQIFYKSWEDKYNIKITTNELIIVGPYKTIYAQFIYDDVKLKNFNKILTDIKGDENGQSKRNSRRIFRLAGEKSTFNEFLGFSKQNQQGRER